MSWKNSDFWHKKTAGLLKLHSTSPQEHFEERSWHVLAFFGAWTDFLTNSGQKLGASLSELHCRWPEELFAQKSVFGNANSLSCFWFRIFSVRSLVYLQEKHRQFVSCQKWIPSLHRNNLRTRNWNFSRAFFLIFGRNNSKF